MRPRAVAWDIDGTLVDSEPVHLLALQQVCQEYKVDLSDLDDSHFIGVHVEAVWQALSSRFPATLAMVQWVGRLNQSYLRNAHRLKPMPGAAETVAELARRGIAQVAVSNSGRVVVNANLSIMALGAHMTFSISLDDVSAGKPDPGPYRAAVHRLGLQPAQVLAVEDSATGMRSARAAGLRVIGYLGQPREQSIVDRAITHLSEVLEEFSADSDNRTDEEVQAEARLSAARRR